MVMLTSHEKDLITQITLTFARFLVIHTWTLIRFNGELIIITTKIIPKDKEEELRMAIKESVM